MQNRIDKTTLPTTPGAIIGYTRRGRPVRLIAGGAPDDGGGQQQQSGGQQGGQQQQSGAGGQQGGQQQGGGDGGQQGGGQQQQQGGDGRAGGQQQLLADLAAERDRRQAAESREAELQRQLEAARIAGLPADQQALEQARTEAAAAARREAEQQSSGTIAAERAARIMAEVRAEAVLAGVRVDEQETEGQPSRLDRFVRLLDLSQLQLGADGSVDRASIRTLIDRELEALPEFRNGAAPPRRAAPGAGQGAQPPAAADVTAQVQSTLGAMQQALGKPVTTAGAAQ